MKKNDKSIDKNHLVSEEELNKMNDVPAVVEADTEHLVDMSEEEIEEAQLQESKNKKGRKKKQKKPPKPVSAKKLPPLLKKAYTEKGLSRLLKKVYVPKQREFLEGFFEENKNPKKPGTYIIDSQRMLERVEYDKLSRIAKEIKKQKFGIKFAPLIAVVATITIVVLTVMTFKNIIVKRAIVSGMQSVFGAKTDIKWVNVEILGASIRVEGLQQADKKEPMKNLFEIQTTIIDFNLTEALRGKVDIQNIAVDGIRVGTPRKTSGALPQKPGAVDEEEISFTEQLKARGEIALNASKKELDNLFNQYNPQTLMADFQSKLKSPAVAKDVQATTMDLINRWKDTPAQMEKQITGFMSSVQDVVITDWSQVKDPAKIKEAVEKITAAINSSKELRATIEKTVNDVKVDGKKVVDLSNQVAAAVKADSDLVNKEVNKIKSFTVKDGFDILSGPIENVICATLGKYYTYIKMGIGYANKAKALSAAIPKKEKKSVEPKFKVHKRAAGRNVYYRADRVPKFLIERISTSGDNFSALATDISSDMDVRGAPAKADAKFSINNQNHKAGLMVDTRKVTNNALITANYSGDNYPIKIDIPQFGIQSPATIAGTGTANADGSFALDVMLNLDDLKFETVPFEPAFGYDLYKRALGHLHQTKVGAKIGWTSDHKLLLKLDTDINIQLAKALKLLVNEELEILKKQAIAKVNELLKDVTKDANFNISEFINIENGINAQSINYANINKLLESKKKELEAQLKAQAGAAMSEAMKNSGMQLPNIPAPVQPGNSTAGQSESGTASGQTQTQKNPSDLLKKLIPMGTKQ
ncbi:MAG: hypothetical protein MJ169_03690 [Treponema sp.]|nr:hypothetical protein [Treponema sp.]